MDYPERELDPPEHYTCEECCKHFYDDVDFDDNEPVLCYECGTFDG